MLEDVGNDAFLSGVLAGIWIAASSSDGLNSELGVPAAWENFLWMTVACKVNDTVKINVDPGDQKCLQQWCQYLLDMVKCQ